MKRAIVKIAKGVGVICGIAVLLIAGWGFSGSWINPFEKAAMKNCLLDIDKVRQFRGVDNTQYKVQVEKTKADLVFCRKRAFTSYDHQLLDALQINFDNAISEQKIWQLPDTSPVKKKMLESIAKDDSWVDNSLREHMDHID